jgi:hypothetical protein
MSYVMEFEDASKVDAKDTEIKYDGFRVVVDPKSLMFVYGMTLNYRFAATPCLPVPATQPCPRVLSRHRASRAAWARVDEGKAVAAAQFVTNCPPRQRANVPTKTNCACSAHTTEFIA